MKDENVLNAIEDKLGIDCAIVLKALIDGVYVRAVDEEGDVHFTSTKWNFINAEDKCLESFLDPHPHKLFFKEYGNVWALTEEELGKGDGN